MIVDCGRRTLRTNWLAAAAITFVCTSTRLLIFSEAGSYGSPNSGKDKALASQLVSIARTASWMRSDSFLRVLAIMRVEGNIHLRGDHQLPLFYMSLQRY